MSTGIWLNGKYEKTAGNARGTNEMKGATENRDGVAGLAPKPLAGQQDKFLRGDGGWTVPHYAMRAENDGDGNNIKETYLTVADYQAMNKPQSSAPVNPEIGDSWVEEDK